MEQTAAQRMKQKHLPANFDDYWPRKDMTEEEKEQMLNKKEQEAYRKQVFVSTVEHLENIYKALTAADKALVSNGVVPEHSIRVLLEDNFGLHSYIIDLLAYIAGGKYCVEWIEWYLYEVSCGWIKEPVVECPTEFVGQIEEVRVDSAENLYYFLTEKCSDDF